MNPIPFIATLILAGTLTALVQADDNGADSQRMVMRLEHEWDDAIVKRDATTLDRILAKDYRLTTPDGQLVTKEQLLKSLRRARIDSFEVTGIDNDEMEARIYGETAVVYTRFTLKGRAGGRDVATPFRHTDVFVKQSGRWRCVARQATRIVEENDQAREDAPGRGRSLDDVGS